MRISLFAGLLATLSVGGCQTEKSTSAPSVIFGKDWYYTHQQPEPKEGFLTYRLKGTADIVPGMGIDGFRLDQGGKFVLHTQGPADEVLDVPGTWQAEEGGSYRITLQNEEPPYQLTIQVQNDTTLLARKQ
ncbi:hypothetical protein [Hymenobacter rigui]|uniref:Lipocalin-like domain-containing protein n=1 Tax=Hymenobacter rigui TaxID=334424 RepID=A0A428KX54_9BACT|nr:hypothetical protein [Hymenobacter rigui]RSK51413.1 hypothetical protein EI291_03645 [Hymenobacter rigui]